MHRAYENFLVASENDFWASWAANNSGYGHWPTKILVMKTKSQVWLDMMSG